MDVVVELLALECGCDGDLGTLSRLLVLDCWLAFKTDCWLLLLRLLLFVSGFELLLDCLLAEWWWWWFDILGFLVLSKAIWPLEDAQQWIRSQQDAQSTTFAVAGAAIWCDAWSPLEVKLPFVDWFVKLAWWCLECLCLE